MTRLLNLPYVYAYIARGGGPFELVPGLSVTPNPIISDQCDWLYCIPVPGTDIYEVKAGTFHEFALVDFLLDKMCL